MTNKVQEEVFKDYEVSAAYNFITFIKNCIYRTVHCTVLKACLVSMVYNTYSIHDILVM